MRSALAFSFSKDGASEQLHAYVPVAVNTPSRTSASLSSPFPKKTFSSGTNLRLQLRNWRLLPAGRGVPGRRESWVQYCDMIVHVVKGRETGSEKKRAR